jgi:hypothetical protein
MLPTAPGTADIGKATERPPLSHTTALCACFGGGRHLIAVCVAYPGAMLWSTAYLESRLPRPLPTKDGGTLYAVKDVRAYVLGLPNSRSEHLYWQRAHQLLLDQTDVVTLRRQVELALFCDAQLDLEAMDTV